MQMDVRAALAKQINALNRDAAGHEDIPTHAAILTTSGEVVKL
jgi:hypothetical protein